MIINGIEYNIKPFADLRGANLRGADLRDADLRGAMRNNQKQKATPLTIMGGQYPTMIWDSHVEVGRQTWTFSEFDALTEYDWADQFDAGKALIAAAITYKLECLKCS